MKRVNTARAAAVALVIAALSACSPASASIPNPSTTAPASTPRAAATVTTGAAPSGSPEEAVQQVIQRGNTEQEQAIASRDPSVMKDTGVDAYYQEMAQTNQDMLDSGIVSIKLVKLEWGLVTITGDTASATTYETWTTDYADGTTDQSRDRNVYTLVRQNGAWKVQADDHPDEDTGAPPASGRARPSPSGRASPTPSAPRSSSAAGGSHNWAGYAATGSGFTGVSGTWTVPDASGGSTLGHDAVWVGIGGVGSKDLIQAGTDETVVAPGRIEFQTWSEVQPEASQQAPLPVHAGDSVTVSINQTAARTWLISFKNNTTGASYVQTVQYSSSLSSAEWVVEAPSGMRTLLPLDDFGTVSFAAASAVKDGKTVNLSQARARPVTMINANEQPLAIPSAIQPNGSEFTVTRTANPSTGFGRGFSQTPGRQRGGF